MNEKEYVKSAKKISPTTILIIVAVVLLCIAIGLVAYLMKPSGKETIQEDGKVITEKEMVENEKYPANASDRKPWAFYVEDIDWEISLSQLRQETSGFYEDEDERSLTLVYKGFENFYEGETLVRHAVTPFGERSLTEVLIPYEEKLYEDIISYFEAESQVVDGETTYERILGNCVMYISNEEEGIYICILNLFGMGK